MRNAGGKRHAPPKINRETRACGLAILRGRSAMTN
jgi:hypothetical protein